MRKKDFPAGPPGPVGLLTQTGPNEGGSAPGFARRNEPAGGGGLHLKQKAADIRPRPWNV